MSERVQTFKTKDSADPRASSRATAEDRRRKYDPDVTLFRALPPDYKYNRLHITDPALISRGQKLRKMNEMNVPTGKFAVAEQLFDEIIDCVNGGVEGHCLVIHGRSGAGKSHILKHLRKRSYLQETETDEGVYRPLLSIEAPSPCKLRTLGENVMHGTKYRAMKKLTEAEIWDRARASMINQSTSILFIDEMHNVLQGRSENERRLIANTFKSLMVSEQAPIQLVLCGLGAVKDFVTRYTEFGRRTYFLEVEPLVTPRDNKILKSFLRGLEKEIGMPTCGFTEHDMPVRFMNASRGLIGRMAAFSKLAARLAITLDHGEVERDYLGEVYRRIHSVPSEENPFLMDNPFDYVPPKNQAEDDMTYLRGTQKQNEDAPSD